jgi:23S rRNA (uracil1939-C5)-methyltransferase
MTKPPVKAKKPAAKRPLPPIEVEIARLDDEGVGIGRHEGREVLVAGALPGEKVAAAVEHAGQRRLIGRLTRVLTPHPDRIASPCPHAGVCQGCLLVTLAYPAQLRFKEVKVRAALARFEGLRAATVHPVWGAPHPLGYRTSAKLVFGRARGRVKLGLYRRGTHEVVDIGDCPLHHPLINRIVAVVREEVERQGVFVFDPVKRRGLLRYLAVRVSPATGKAMVTFVTAERSFTEVTHLGKWLQKKVPEVVSVQQNVNPSEGNVIFGRETLKMLGAPDLLDQVGEVRLRLAPTSFFQVNHDQAARIYELVRRWAALSRAECALDLYCGIGGIALHLARDAGRVIGVEAVEEAVKNARENARMNGLPNCAFFAGDAAGLLPELAAQLPPGSVAVVNPPRGGCEEAVLRVLAGLRPRTLLYVSCNPETLARDLDLLRTLGYRTAELQPVDMFPQTPHVETVARLVPAPTSPAPPAAPAPAPRRGSRDTSRRSPGKAGPRGRR